VPAVGDLDRVRGTGAACWHLWHNLAG